jgi:predicted nucleotide-binding protein
VNGPGYFWGDMLSAVIERSERETRATTVTSKQLTSQKQPCVFVGHGASDEWRKLTEYLRQELELHCIEFNSETKSGSSTKERLEEMLDQSTFAFLVMTAEDAHADGSIHARENVVHEVGLFQGRLGFSKAIVLLEEGCAEFSNMAGLTHILFEKGNMQAKFHDIIRVLKREDVVRISTNEGIAN